MFLINLIRYIRGYVRFEARGVFIERFLNLAARDRVSIWDSRKRGDTYSGKVSAASYFRLRAHARKTGVRIRVCEKRGMPFQRRRIRGRKGLLAGLALFAAFLMGMSQFIWSIQVSGGVNVPEERILDVLESIGVKPGVTRRSVPVREAESRAMLMLPELSWLALNIDGSVIHVEVSESVPPPKMVDPEDPCNVVASKSGQIVSMNIYEGQPVLRNGDAVLEGQLIISGITQDRLSKNLFRHARAQVIARVSHELEVREPLVQTVYTETGKTVSRRSLRFFGIDIPLFLPFTVEGPYRAERSLTPLRAFSWELPLTFRRETYILMREETVTYGEDEARERALARLNTMEEVELTGAEILEREVTGRLSGGEFVVSARYVCLMDIALEKEILHDE